jgi:hypothetical protein
MRASAAIENPRKRLPQSPMKMRAGLKLKARNPSAAPPMALPTATVVSLPVSPPNTVITRAAMPAMPAASPSMLSRRLTALVMPMTQSKVRGNDSHRGQCRPKAYPA